MSRDPWMMRGHASLWDVGAGCMSGRLTSLACRCAAPEQDPQVLPYLRQAHRTSYDIKLQVSLTPQDNQQATILSRSNFRHLCAPSDFNASYQAKSHMVTR